MSANVAAARERVVQAVLRLLSSERSNEGNAHYGDELEYAGELIALAARDLTRAVEALPADERPVGWNRERQRAAEVAE